MKYFAIVVAVVISACGGGEQNGSDDLVEEPAEDIVESVSGAWHDQLEEAEEVEELLLEKARAVDEAVDEATDR